MDLVQFRKKNLGECQSSSSLALPPPPKSNSKVVVVALQVWKKGGEGQESSSL